MEKKRKKLKKTYSGKDELAERGINSASIDLHVDLYIDTF